MIEVKTVANSVGEHSPRLWTVRATAPKFIHQETLRHRLIYVEDALRGDPDFSFSVSSARAIPFAKLLEEVRDPERRAKPVKWGAEQRGMSMGDEIDGVERKHSIEAGSVPWRTDQDQAEYLWEQAALYAARYAEKMARLGLHKSIVNRVIEPYIHVHCLMTATEPGWMNFFGLRLDRAADDTVRALAEAAWVRWREDEPRKLAPGEWHLPYVDSEADLALCQDEHHRQFANPSHPRNDTLLKIMQMVSVARCARLSYSTFENPDRRSTIEEDLSLYERLIGSSPIHASPAEHQCTPDEPRVWGEFDFHKIGDCDGASSDDMTGALYWKNPELHGNVKGWKQFRKMLPREALAPLPQEYAR